MFPSIPASSSRQGAGVRVNRIDVGRLDKFERTPTGGLRIPASLTRTGVLSYTTAEGLVIRELRPPDEVFAPESIASFQDAAVTDLHPEMNITPDTWKRDAVGHVREVRREGDFLIGEVLVQDKREIGLVESGERVEVSSGYTCELEATPGVFEGKAYDAIQRNIRYNHAGLGPAGWGRAGAEVALRLDAAHELIAGAEPPTRHQRSDSMAKVNVGGISYDVGSSSHIEALELAARTATGERDELRGRHDTLTEQVTTLTTERDDARKDAKEKGSQTNIDDAVNARLAIIDRARRVLGADFDGTGKTDAEVMSAALESKGVKLDEEAAGNADYMRGRFEQITDQGDDEDNEDGEHEEDEEEEEEETEDAHGVPHDEDERGDSRRRRPGKRPKRARTATRRQDGERDRDRNLTAEQRVRRDNAEHAAKATERFALNK